MYGRVATYLTVKEYQAKCEKKDLENNNKASGYLWGIIMAAK